MSKKICLTPSNQPENKYAYGNTNEKIQCGRIAECAKTALIRCGFEVLVLQEVELSEKVNQSNKWGADLHIPIHTNAYNKQVTGTRLFYKSTNEKRACEAIFKHLAPITPGKSENISYNSTFYEINNAKAPVAYIEAEFHDVPAAAKWIVENPEAIGEAIARGVCDYFGVKYVEKSKKIYRVQIGAFSVKENAEAQLKKAKAAGFTDAFITEVNLG